MGDGACQEKDKAFIQVVSFLKHSPSPAFSAATSTSSKSNFFKNDFVSASCLFILISSSTLNPLQSGFSPHYSTKTVLANFVMTSFLLHAVGVYQPWSLPSLSIIWPCPPFLLLHRLSLHRICGILYSQFSFHTSGYFFTAFFLGSPSSFHLMCWSYSGFYTRFSSPFTWKWVRGSSS